MKPNAYTTVLIEAIALGRKFHSTGMVDEKGSWIFDRMRLNFVNVKILRWVYVDDAFKLASSWGYSVKMEKK